MSLQPLWAETNRSVYSQVFNVPYHQCCVLYAANFEPYKTRLTADEFAAPQVACVRRVLYGFNAGQPADHLTCCWIFDIDTVVSEKIVDQLVQGHCGAWQLSMCRNIGIIGVPGVYRLELNDESAVGRAQVYAELYDIEGFPIQVKDLFFS